MSNNDSANQLKKDIYKSITVGSIHLLKESLEKLLELQSSASSSTISLSSPPNSIGLISTSAEAGTDANNSEKPGELDSSPTMPENTPSPTLNGTPLSTPTSPSLLGPNRSKPLTLDQIILKTTYPEEYDINPLHLAAKHNQLEVLQYLMGTCCDDNCATDKHSFDCQRKMNALLSSVDKQNATPLFYAIQSGGHNACGYICSFKSVQESLNIHSDRYGFLPLHLAFKRKDWELCETLQLFGAKLDTTVGIGVGLGESVLHVAVRDKSMDSVEYLAKTKPGLLLKKNQQEENALFSCLTDFRGMRTKKIVSSFLSTLLPRGGSLFEIDAFERAIMQKNAHGRNILMEAIAKNDMSSLFAILEYLSNEKSKTKNRIIPILINEHDSQQKNIIHLCVQSVFSTGMAFDSDTEEASIDWMNALYWIYDFIENCGSVKVSQMAKLFTEKDKYNHTPAESCSQFYDATTDQQEPLIIAEAITESLIDTQTFWTAGKKRKHSKNTRKSLKTGDLDDINSPANQRSSLSGAVMDFFGITVKRGYRK